MAFRIGVLSTAHLHFASYGAVLRDDPTAEMIGFWDDDDERAAWTEKTFGLPRFQDAEALVKASDGVVVCSENVRHYELVMLAARHGKHALSEKPLATKVEEGEAMIEACRSAGVVLATAFPCPFSPAFAELTRRRDSGELGRILALATTNRGSCPFSWFVQPEKSGGGALIDHVVHVADLLRRLMGASPVAVHALTGNGMYGETWEDVAMLTLEYPNGVFATLDSSWSRPKSYKTWGDVTMNVTFEKGVVELDLFGQQFDHYSNESMRHSVAGFGTNIDAYIIKDFLEACRTGGEPRSTGVDGLEAAKVALAGYESVRTGQPARVS